jgi:hypothetical protein
MHRPPSRADVWRCGSAVRNPIAEVRRRPLVVALVILPVCSRSSGVESDKALEYVPTVRGPALSTPTVDAVPGVGDRRERNVNGAGEGWVVRFSSWPWLGPAAWTHGSERSGGAWGQGRRPISSAAPNLGVPVPRSGTRSPKIEPDPCLAFASGGVGRRRRTSGPCASWDGLGRPTTLSFGANAVPLAPGHTAGGQRGRRHRRRRAGGEGFSGRPAGPPDRPAEPGQPGLPLLAPEPARAFAPKRRRFIPTVGT